MTRRAVRPGDPSRAVAYVRVSTDRQELGTEAQRAAIERHASAHGFAVVSWRHEIASGTLPVEKRPELLAALADLREHGAGLLVVARRDRLARDVVIAAVATSLVEREGARVLSCAGEGSDDQGPSGQFLRSVIDAASAYEVGTLRARTRAALAARRAKGLRTGELPWGFRADDTGHLVAFEPEREARALACYLRGHGCTLREIQASLVRRGYLARSGHPLSLPAIRKLCLPPETPTP